MTSEATFENRRATIDDRIEATLASADGGCLAPAGTAARASEDRWYGQLVTVVFEATTDGSPRVEPVVPAAAAIELLRGYCRLRAEILDRIHGEGPRPSRGELTPSLLSGDHLYASALSAATAVDGRVGRSCVDRLTAVSETIIEAFDAATDRPTGRASDDRWLLDNTVGALGEGAAVLGALVGGAEAHRRSHFAAIGRGFATGRAVTVDDDLAAVTVPGVATVRDDPDLHRHAKRRLADADLGLDALPSAVDVTTLRAFREETVGLAGPVSE